MELCIIDLKHFYNIQVATTKENPSLEPEKADSTINRQLLLLVATNEYSILFSISCSLPA